MNLLVFTSLYIHKKKELDWLKLSTSGFRWICMFWDILNTIWPFLNVSVCRSVCMYVSKILWTLYLKDWSSEIDETLYSVSPCYNLVLLLFWCISLKKFWCYSKFLISLTQWHRTQLRAIVSNTNYFKHSTILKLFKHSIILKFKIYL